MAVITLEEQRSKLHTTEEMFKRLKQTDPSGSTHISADSHTRFRILPAIEAEIPSTKDTQPVSAFMSVGSGAAQKEYQMTREGLIQAAALAVPGGLSLPQLRGYPSHLIEGLLNYAYSGGMGNTHLKTILVKDRVAAFTRPNIEPYLDSRLLEQALVGIEKVYGNVEVLVDYKAHNTLKTTSMPLIIPSVQREITDAGMDGIGEDQRDFWWAGLHLKNSLIGDGQTGLEAYLMRLVCTNGMITMPPGMKGSWDRRFGDRKPGDDTTPEVAGDPSNPETVYAWMAKQVEEVFQDVEARFDAVQATTRERVNADSREGLKAALRGLGVPLTQANEIAREFGTRADDLSLYEMMQAITRRANDAPNDRAQKLWRIGGDIIGARPASEKAEIWREGHEAEDDTNPYALFL